MDPSANQNKAASSLSRSKLGDMLDPLSFFAQTITHVAMGRDGADVGSHTKKRPESSPQKGARAVDPALVGENSLFGGKEDAFPAGLDSDAASSTVRASVARPSGSAVGASSLSEPEDMRMLSGESKVIVLPDAQVQTSVGKYVVGRLFMTTYRMVFLPPTSALQAHADHNPSVHTMLSIPLACIDRVEREKKSKDQRGLTTIIVWGKDCRVLRFTIQTTRRLQQDPALSDAQIESEIDRTIRAIQSYAFPGPSFQHFLFAFSHKFPLLNGATAHQFVDINAVLLAEFERQGVLRERGGAPTPWRLTYQNQNFKLCDSYPQLLVVPRAFPDDDLPQVAAFRSGQRLPALSWGTGDDAASLWRSAQPKVGMNATSEPDERLLAMLAAACHGRTNTGGNVLYIIDCRPRANAVANRAAGAGYESTTNYPNARLEFYNIGNIHVMRDSIGKLTSLVLSYTNQDAYFSSQIDESKWLTHVRLVINASYEAADLVRRKSTVLVHCSHGWDRTSQVVALAQIFLDPYYRTMDGFPVLIEKDWLAFGHPFQLRSAHGEPKSSRQDDQTSPIFLQFLDCVWQLVSQYPQYFEFGTQYLLAIADHIYSCRFGTFLCDNERERELLSSRTRCSSLWSYLSANRHKLANPLYMPPDVSSNDTTAYFFPPLQSVLRNVTLWADYFLRWSVVPSHPRLPHVLASYMYSKGTQKACPMLDQVPEDDEEDSHLPPMVSSSDFWQAAFRQERHLRIQYEKRLKRLEEKLQQLGDGDTLRSVQDSLMEPFTPSVDDESQPPMLADESDLIDPEAAALDAIAGQVEDVTPRNAEAAISTEDDPEAYEQFDDHHITPTGNLLAARSDSVASDL